MQCFQGGVFVSKRADTGIHCIPLHGAGLGRFLSLKVQSLFALYVLGQQVLDRGGQVLAVGTGLLHQAFAEGQVDGTLARSGN